MDVQRIAAFSDGSSGGTPAGVVLCEILPAATAMRRSQPKSDIQKRSSPRLREIAGACDISRQRLKSIFAGTLTIALGAALAVRQGDGIFPLQLNDVRITVEGRRTGTTRTAALQSPPTRSHPANNDLIGEALRLFGLSAETLDQRIPPAIAHAGADHLVLALCSRTLLSMMRYDLSSGQTLARRESIGTFSLLYAAGPQLFHARNPFPIGGVYEDPATGAAAAALAGYLRDLCWPHTGAVEIFQGEDMGVPSRLRAEITSEPGASIRVSGGARLIHPASAAS